MGFSDVVQSLDLALYNGVRVLYRRGITVSFRERGINAALRCLVGLKLVSFVAGDMIKRIARADYKNGAQTDKPTPSCESNVCLSRVSGPNLCIHYWRKYPILLILA
ncbi:hypothetical protein [Caballeronia sp. LjRoot31]|uniref:hypothetical protein n=1 Tax=Caballeronia sp. LjRoot31 TaxID=3342324 RepID=UPI003ECF6909